MVYAGAHISGGHYNPAVSLAAFIRGKLDLQGMGLYWVVQLAGAAVAAFTVLYLRRNPALQAAAPAVLPALVAEFLFTFGLCFVFLNVTTAKRTDGNSYFGFAIGMITMVGAYAVGTISGAAFNPAAALGLSIMGLFDWPSIWIYLVAELAGAAVAAFVFRAAHPSE